MRTTSSYEYCVFLFDNFWTSLENSVSTDRTEVEELLSSLQYGHPDWKLEIRHRLITRTAHDWKSGVPVEHREWYDRQSKENRDVDLSGLIRGATDVRFDEGEEAEAI